MNRLKFIGLGFAVAGVAWLLAGFYIQVTNNRAYDLREIKQYGTIHKIGEYCPDGWEESPKVFTEEDGSTQDACVNPRAHGGSVDVLHPGESMKLYFTLPGTTEEPPSISHGDI